MKEVKSLRYLLLFSVPLVFFPSVFLGFYPGKIVIVQSLCFYTLLFLFWASWRFLPREEFAGKKIMVFYFVYAAITYLRGFTEIEYWADWISLASSMVFTSFLLPYMMFLGSPDCCSKIFRSFIKFGIPLCVIGAIWLSSDEQQNFAHNLVIVNMLVLLLPEMKWKWRLMIIAIAFFVSLYDLDRRSILVGYAVPFLLLFAWPFLRVNLMRKFVVSTMFALPIVLLSLGLAGIFNIFEYMENSSDLNISGSDRGTMVDSRTGIYEDVFKDLINNNIWVSRGVITRPIPRLWKFRLMM